MPAASATASTLVASKPRSMNIEAAISMRRSLRRIASSWDGRPPEWRRALSGMGGVVTLARPICAPSDQNQRSWSHNALAFSGQHPYNKTERYRSIWGGQNEYRAFEPPRVRADRGRLGPWQ